MIQVQSADGVLHQFPDGTQPNVIDGAMKAYAPQSRANIDAKQRAATTPGVVRALNNGFAFNAAGNVDALGAAAETGVHNLFAHATGQADSGYGMKEAFNAVRGAEANASNSFAQAHPVQNVAANIGGAAVNPFNRSAGAYVGRAGSLAQAITRSAGTGAVLGSAYGAGGTQPGQNPFKTAAAGATIGGITGAAAPVVAKVAGAVGQAISARKPDTEAVVGALQSAKTQAYQKVRDMGVAYTPQAASDLAQGISDELSAANISATRHPKAFSMMQDIKGRLGTGELLTMDDLDLMRQEVRRDVSSPRNDPAERFFGDKIIHNIDEFTDSAGPGQMINGDGPQASQAIRQARALNTRYRKVDAIQNAVDSADLRAASTGSGGNVNNATRQKLRPFIDPQSSKQMRNLTPEEGDLLNQAVRGTPITNALRQVGKLSPEGNGLNFMLHAGGALTTHGATLPVAIGGWVAKRVADQQTANTVQKLIVTMAKGAPGEAGAAEQQFTALAQRNPQVSALYRELQQTLTGAAPGVAVTASSRP